MQSSRSNASTAGLVESSRVSIQPDGTRRMQAAFVLPVSPKKKEKTKDYGTGDPWTAGETSDANKELRLHDFKIGEVPMDEQNTTIGEMVSKLKWKWRGVLRAV